MGAFLHIAIGCDHRGLTLKQYIIGLLEREGHSYEDFGCYDESPADYPDIAEKVGGAVSEGQCERGILVCSTGIGMSMAANKIRGVRAALCHNVFTARRSREHNDSNVLCLGGSVVEQGLAQEMVREYLAAEFEGGRHEGRLCKIADLEAGNG